MEHFANETIDTTQLPRYEAITLTPLHPNYWYVALLGLSFVFLIIGIALAVVWYNTAEFEGYSIHLIIGFLLLLIVGNGINFISFKKKAYAFRNHDVIFRSGIIATNTMVIPYNRVQHVALHEGIISRYFGLAKVEIFTAGGSSSDIEIPGIAKEEAENIKQLLMGKIQKQL